MSGPGHSHEERWRLCSTVPSSGYEAAEEIRKILRTSKAALFAIGAGALVPTGPAGHAEVSQVAHRLSERCRASAVILAAESEENELRPLLQVVVEALNELDVWAHAIVASHGVVTSEAAGGLRSSYSRLRRAADPFWHLELVPEGRTESVGETKGLP